MTGALLVALGAAIGAPTRYLVDRAVQANHASRMPWGTLVVNVGGAFVLGLLTGLAVSHDVPRAVMLALGVGFCGALTTFSTFSYETLRLWESDRRRSLLNVGLSVGLSLGAAVVGHLLGSIL